VVVAAAVVPVVEVRQEFLQAWKRPLPLQLLMRPHPPRVSLIAQSEVNLFAIVVVIEAVIEAVHQIRQTLFVVMLLVV